MSNQRGFTEFSVFLKQVSLLGSYEFCGFSFRWNGGGASKLGSILGRDRGLVNNCLAAAGGALNWAGRALNSS